MILQWKQCITIFYQCKCFIIKFKPNSYLSTKLLPNYRRNFPQSLIRFHSMTRLLQPLSVLPKMRKVYYHFICKIIQSLRLEWKVIKSLEYISTFDRCFLYLFLFSTIVSPTQNFPKLKLKYSYIQDFINAWLCNCLFIYLCMTKIRYFCITIEIKKTPGIYLTISDKKIKNNK